MTRFAGLPGFVSAEEAAEHNATIEAVFKEYEQYLRDWPAVVNRYRRSLELTFVLENAGTAPADGLHVRLWTSADGVWLEELPDPPQPPAVPKRRGPFDISPAFSVADLEPVDFWHHDRETDGPTITEGDPQRVEFKVKRVTHRVPCELPAVYFQFRTDEGVKSFKIQYQLVAANIPDPKMGAVHVKLSVAAPMAPPLPGGPAEK